MRSLESLGFVSLEPLKSPDPPVGVLVQLLGTLSVTLPTVIEESAV